MLVPSAFEYATIRLVPQIETGECMNVGVLLLCRTQHFLDARMLHNTQQLQVFADTIDIEALERYLRYVPIVCYGGEHAGPIGALPIYERFRWLTAPRNTILQPSPVHCGICDHPQQMLERLAQTLIRL